MLGTACAIACGIALTWTAAAVGLFLLSELTVGHGCHSDAKAARLQVLEIEDILLQYRIEHGRCPATWNELLANGYVRAKDIADPWGKDIGYSCSGQSDADPMVASAGPDKVFGTADDVRNER